MDEIILWILLVLTALGILPGIIIASIHSIYDRTYYAINKKAKIKIQNEVEKIVAKETEILNAEVEEIRERIDEYKQLERELKESISQEYPYLANSISDFYYCIDLKVATYLENKYRPAKSTASEIKHNIARDKKDFMRQSIAYRNQLEFYEEMFPWLLDFKQLSPREAISFRENPERIYTQHNEEHWLSPAEFAQLKPVEISQLALDRWKRRHKTKWEIGIEYEQYIGFILESQGYRVEYQGAKLGLEDMGIDLIAELNGDTWIIQCKRWNENKTIHEKHIFQLYGSKVLYEIQHPEKKSHAMFVIAQDNLSDLAKQCAEKLDVHVRVSPHKDHPLIKCNINNGEKIYHLPMDQQYHRIIIDMSKGEFYAWTAEEAEKAGFRRAIRHTFEP